MSSAAKESLSVPLSEMSRPERISYAAYDKRNVETSSVNCDIVIIIPRTISWMYNLSCYWFT